MWVCSDVCCCISIISTVGAGVSPQAPVFRPKFNRASNHLKMDYAHRKIEHKGVICVYTCKQGGLMYSIWDWQATIVKDFNDSTDPKHTFCCEKKMSQKRDNVKFVTVFFT